MPAPVLLALLLQTQVPTVTAISDPSFHSPESLDLVRVGTLIRVPGARVLLTDYDGETIFLLDSTGKALPPLARKGSGPGEVRGAATVGWVGDTLWVADRILRRVSFFSPSLKFLRSQADNDRCGDMPWTIVPDGRCLTLPQRAVPPDQPIPDSLPFFLTRPGGPTDTLGWLVMPRMVIRYRDAESHVRQEFADDPRPATSRNGRYFAWVGQRRSRPDGNAMVAVEVRDLSTGVLHRFEVPFAPQPLPRDTVAKVLARYRKDRLFTNAPGLVDSVDRHLYRPRFLPAFASVFLDGLGRLWLREQFTPGSATALWRVHRPDGSPVFNVRLPSRFQLTDVSGPVLLGTALDDDEIPVLMQFRLPATRQ